MRFSVFDHCVTHVTEYKNDVLQNLQKPAWHLLLYTKINPRTLFIKHTRDDFQRRALTNKPLRFVIFICFQRSGPTNLIRGSKALISPHLHHSPLRILRIWSTTSRTWTISTALILCTRMPTALPCTTVSIPWRLFTCSYFRRRNYEVWRKWATRKNPSSDISCLLPIASGQTSPGSGTGCASTRESMPAKTMEWCFSIWWGITSSVITWDSMRRDWFCWHQRRLTSCGNRIFLRCSEAWLSLKDFLMSRQALSK